MLAGTADCRTPSRKLYFLENHGATYLQALFRRDFADTLLYNVAFGHMHAFFLVYPLGQRLDPTCLHAGCIGLWKCGVSISSGSHF